MISLGTPATAKLQSQVGEALSTIASQDFPEEWNGLVDVSTSRCLKDQNHTKSYRNSCRACRRITLSSTTVSWRRRTPSSAGKSRDINPWARCNTDAFLTDGDRNSARTGCTQRSTLCSSGSANLTLTFSRMSTSSSRHQRLSLCPPMLRLNYWRNRYYCLLSSSTISARKISLLSSRTTSTSLWVPRTGTAVMDGCEST